MLKKPTSAFSKRTSHCSCTRVFSRHSLHHRVSDYKHSENGTIRCCACAHCSVFATRIDRHNYSAVIVTIVWLSVIIGSVRECETTIPGVANIPQQQKQLYFNLTCSQNHASYSEFPTLPGGKDLACANGTELAGCHVHTETAHHTVRNGVLLNCSLFPALYNQRGVSMPARGYRVPQLSIARVRS